MPEDAGNGSQWDCVVVSVVTSVHHTFRQYDVAPDGQKFIINTVFEQSVEPITVYANWERELKR